MEPQPSRDPLNAAAHVYTRVRLALNAARRWPRNTARKFLGALTHAFRAGVCKAGRLLMVAKLVRLLTSSMVTVRRAGRSRKPSGLPRSGPGGDERAAPPPPTGRLALCGAVSRLSDRTTRSQCVAISITAPFWSNALALPDARPSGDRKAASNARFTLGPAMVTDVW